MLLACALALTLGMPAAAPLLTPAEIERVLQGEILFRSEPAVTPSGKTAGYGIGAIAIDRPLEATWSVVARYDDKAEYQPRLTRCTVVSRTGEVLRVAMAVDAALMTVTYTGIYTLDPVAHTVHWELDKQAAGNTLADMDGTTALIAAAPGKTILTFRTYVDSGHLVPHFLQNFFSANAIPDLLKAVKMRVETDGKWHK